MKVRMTIRQLKKVLENEIAKFPITVIMSGIDKEELKELIEILKKNKKG